MPYIPIPLWHNGTLPSYSIDVVDVSAVKPVIANAAASDGSPLDRVFAPFSRWWSARLGPVHTRVRPRVIGRCAKIFLPLSDLMRSKFQNRVPKNYQIKKLEGPSLECSGRSLSAVGDSLVHLCHEGYWVPPQRENRIYGSAAHQRGLASGPSSK
jgi:hypothetical protein